MPEADGFSRSSQSAMSKSLDHPLPARNAYSHENSRKHRFANLMQPCLVWLCLVFRRGWFAADFDSEPDQRSIEVHTKSCLIHCLAIGHLVVHVCASISHHSSFSNHRCHCSVFYSSNSSFPQCRWFLNDQEYSSHASVVCVLTRFDDLLSVVCEDPFWFGGTEVECAQTRCCFCRIFSFS